MKVEKLETIGSWQNVLNSARTTISKDSLNKEPSSEFKKKILLSEHSPIRQLMFRFRITDLPSWVSVHLVRHKFGIEHFVSTQRSDRTGEDRNSARQDAKVTHEMLVNVQGLINISRKRLCSKASKETRETWQALLDTIKEGEPEIYNVCVVECVYRGFCPEFESCGKIKTDKYIMRRVNYQKIEEIK